jgi:hypothetical protein
MAKYKQKMLEECGSAKGWWDNEEKGIPDLEGIRAQIE